MKRKVLFTTSLVLTILLLVSAAGSAFVSVPVKKVSLDATSLTLSTGESYQLKAAVTPANATNKTLKWYTSDSKTVSVDNKGKIKALKTGKAFITVKSADGKVSASCNIKVVQKNAAPTVIKVLVQDNYLAEKSYAQGLPVLKEIEKRTNVTIKWELGTAGSGQVQQLAETRLAAGSNLPDLIMVELSDPKILNLAKRGTIIALNDLINKYAPNIKKTYTVDYPLSIKLNTSSDGKLYYLSYVTAYQGAAVNNFLIREDWLKKVGINKLPETMDEFYNALKEMQVKDANGNGLKDEVFDVVGWSQFKMTMPGLFGLSDWMKWDVDSKSKVFYSGITSQAKEFLMFANKLYKEGLVDPELATIPWEKWLAHFQQNTVSAVMNGAANVKYFEDNLKSVPDVKYTILKPLKGPYGTQRVDKVTPYASNSKFFITKACKDPVAVIKFLDYLYSPEGVKLYQHGIEGVHYREVNGKFVLTDEYAQKVKKVGESNANYGEGIHWFCLPTIQKDTIDEAAVTWRPENKQAYQETYNAGKERLIFPPASEKEQKDIEAVGGDVWTYIDEMEVKFFMGKEPFDNWDKYAAKVKELGIDRLTQIYQKMYDRLMNTK